MPHTTQNCRQCEMPLEHMVAHSSLMVLMSFALLNDIKDRVQWVEERGPLCGTCLKKYRGSLADPD